jgi:cytochrome bd-type quinol oxidase subunit 1
MTNVDLARWQFGFTSVNHFLFVPVTIGLAFLTALPQTAWHRSGKEEYLRLTRFFGTLLVINVAIGVVTGLVQEFLLKYAREQLPPPRAETDADRPVPAVQTAPRSSP